MSEINMPICGFCGKKAGPTETYCHGNGDVYICSDCLRTFHMAISEADTYIENNEKKKAAENIPKSRLPTPSQIKAHLDQYIIGQEHAKKVISVAVYNHYKMLKIKMSQAKSKMNQGVELEKSNVMMVGPSGSGKTAIIRAISKFLRVPFTMADISGFSSAGYVGCN